VAVVNVAILKKIARTWLYQS